MLTGHRWKAQRKTSQVTDLINNTDTILNPMEETMTSDKHTTASGAAERSDGNLRNETSTIKNLLKRVNEAGVKEITKKQWQGIRKVAGRRINPENAEVISIYSDALVYSCGAIGVPLLEHFARAPGSDEWIRILDLPGTTCTALLRKHGLIRHDI